MAQLPRGTVTFLFTDIEGSTRLLHEMGDAYEAALKVHRDLLRQVVAACNGAEVDTQGDAFFFAFDKTEEAVEAAVLGQRAVSDYQWPGRNPLRVRMGIHTGEPTVTDEGYVGEDVHRAARICSAAHGGQVLVSEVSAKLLSRSIRAAGLVDVGHHGLKDLTTPQRLYQLTIQGLTNDFPPIRTLESRPNNLPRHLTSLVGRQEEIDQVTELLAREDVILVTLTGPGGAGKTRLAVAVGAEVLGRVFDAVFFVDLSTLRDSAFVIPAIAQTLSLREPAGQTIGETVADYLAGRRFLLILDNFEQVVDAASDVSKLLSSAASLKVLATSRQTLKLQVEREFEVPPLASPSVEVSDVSELLRWPGVSLFVERARAVNSSFELTQENAPAVVEICNRLDGLPLAIELAAARVRMLSPAALLNRLGSRLGLLTGGPRDLPSRQQGLRRTIEWSHELLTEEERELMARMAVFSGPTDVDAVEKVCSQDGADILTHLESLADKSLVKAVEVPGGEPLFAMLETIKEFALERLEERDGAEEARERHADHYLVVAERAHAEIAGPRQVEWLERLERDQDNIYAAIGWSLEQDNIDRALRFGTALHWFWWIRGQLSTGTQWLKAALAETGTDPVLYGRALVAYARLASDHGDFDESQGCLVEARTLAEASDDEDLLANALAELGYVALRTGAEDAEKLTRQALEIFQKRSDTRGEAIVQMRLGTLATRRGDLEKARGMYLRALELRRRTGDPWGIASSLNNIGYDLALQGRFEEAQPYLEECLDLFEKVGFKEGIANVIDTLALIAVGRGDIGGAIELYEKALAMFREMNYRTGIGFELCGLGRARIEFGDWRSGVSDLVEALELGKEIDDEEILAYAYEGIASALACSGRPQRAAELFAASHRFRQEVNIPLPPVDESRVGRFIATLERELDPAAFKTTWSNGVGMSGSELHEAAILEGRALRSTASRDERMGQVGHRTERV